MKINSSFWKKDNNNGFYFIAGPCSAESPEQVAEISESLSQFDFVKMLRFGIWKPRTRPGSFEGKGYEAIKWLTELRKPVIIEVAEPAHVEIALKNGIKNLWIGARTTTNPFSVQAIADTLKGVKDVNMLVKNPVSPDFGLWLGAIERFLKAGISSVAACHRGFNHYLPHKYRNIPIWEYSLKLRHYYPDLALIIDPSHITGNPNYLYEITQKAIDLDYDGAMIEVHPNPSEALSDAFQQITPKNFSHFVSELKFKKRYTEDEEFHSKLSELRSVIDDIDINLLALIKKRCEVVQEIGKLKEEYNITPLQQERWNEILQTRKEWAMALDLPEKFIEGFLELLHILSLDIQEKE